MKKDRLEALLLDYIDGQLSAGEQASVEQLIEQDEATARLYEQLKTLTHLMEESSLAEPPASMKRQFDSWLQSEVVRTPKARQVVLTPFFFRVAAAIAVLAVSAAVVFWVKQQREHAARLAAMQEEVRLTKERMMALLGDQQSASKRVMGITVAYKDVQHADDDIVNALVDAMNNDGNSNVRLAALEALAKFQEEPHVRQALIAALRTQQDPIVQIALIRMLTAMRGIDIKTQLQDIAADETLLPAVKDEAHAALLKSS